MRILYPFKNALWALRPAKPTKRSISASLPNPQTLPLGEGLCMLCWLCICAIVVVCCRCVLHRLCSTTCMRPCKALGHTRPASMPGLSVGLPPSPRLGLRPKPHFQKLYRFFDRLTAGYACVQSVCTKFITALQR